MTVLANTSTPVGTSTITWDGWMRRGLRWSWFAAFFVVIGVLLVFPAVMLLVGAFRTSPPGIPGEWSLAGFEDMLRSAGVLVAIRNSVILATLATFLGCLLAATFALIAQRTDAPLRQLISPAMLITFMTPPLFYAIGFSLLANQYYGLLNGALAALGVPDDLVNIESWPGIVLVMTCRATAFIYLFLAGPFAALNRNHEDASRIAGFGAVETFFRINLPILAPAITGAAILAFVGSLQTFDTALIIGEPAGVRVISTEVFQMLTNESPPRFSTASALSTVLVAVVGVLCFIQIRILSGRNFTTIEGKAGSTQPHALGRWGYLAAGFIALYLLVAQVLPLISLVYGSFQPFPGVHGTLTWLHYERALSLPQIAEAVRTTLLCAVLVGAIAMTLAVLMTQVSRRLNPAGIVAVRFATQIPHAMPGIVTALAVTWAYVSVPGLREIYGTIWIMIIALVTVVTPFAVQASQAAAAQIGVELEEAARVSGGSFMRTMWTVVGPLLAPSFMYGWFVTGVVVIGSLDIPLLLAPPGLSTVASTIYQLNMTGQVGDAAALLVTLLIFMTGFALAVRQLTRLRPNRRRALAGV